MTDYSYLEVTRHINPLGETEQYTYKWIGKSPYVKIGWMFLREFDKDHKKEIQFGPYKLLKVDDEPWHDDVLFVRKDNLSALRVALYKSTRLLDLIYRRLIITLAVWRLAEFHEMCIPSWRDIKIFKRKK